MRVARIEVGWDYLLRVLHGHEMCKEVTDIPDDARVLGVSLDPTRRVLHLDTESVTFAEVPEYNLIPPFNPKVTVSVTEMSMLADLVSRRHDFCRHCGEPLADDA
jgi:hypothetical protein